MLADVAKYRLLFSTFFFALKLSQLFPKKNLLFLTLDFSVRGTLNKLQEVFIKLKNVESLITCTLFVLFCFHTEDILYNLN